MTHRAPSCVAIVVNKVTTAKAQFQPINAFCAHRWFVKHDMALCKMFVDNEPIKCPVLGCANWVYYDMEQHMKVDEYQPIASTLLALILGTTTV